MSEWMKYYVLASIICLLINENILLQKLTLNTTDK